MSFFILQLDYLLNYYVYAFRMPFSYFNLFYNFLS